MKQRFLRNVGISIVILMSSIVSVVANETQNITRGEAFQFFASFYEDFVPSSSQYIDLRYTDIADGTEVHDALQDLVYLDFINNTSTKIYPNKEIDVYTFQMLASRILGVSVKGDASKAELSKIKTTHRDLETVKQIVENRKNTVNVDDAITGPYEQIKILEDVYKTLLEDHYDRQNLESKELLYNAIEGLAEGTEDDYTTYFPPVENKDFQQSLSWEYEGIGAYVEMPEPGHMIIISPIVGSPSEKAGLKWGDIITHVDGKEVTSENSLKEVVSWIKWPAGSSVTLTIKRGKSTLEIDVERAKIVIKDIEYEKINATTYYIQIKNFWPHVAKDFTNVMEELAKEKSITKVIFDLRNNPGWYLDQVNKMLSHFIEKGEPTAIVNDGGIHDTRYTSAGYNVVDFSQYDIIFLQNGGSASASEIMIGSVKDYYPDAILIGEKTFGKGSVQSIKEYTDGSSLKYTIAKWFTGKTRTGIDGVGITPDVELELNQTDYENWFDNQLDAALRK